MLQNEFHSQDEFVEYVKKYDMKIQYLSKMNEVYRELPIEAYNGSYK